MRRTVFPLPNFRSKQTSNTRTNVTTLGACKAERRESEAVVWNFSPPTGGGLLRIQSAYQTFLLFLVHYHISPWIFPIKNELALRDTLHVRICASLVGKVIWTAKLFFFKEKRKYLDECENVNRIHLRQVDSSVVDEIHVYIRLYTESMRYRTIIDLKFDTYIKTNRSERYKV